MYFLLDSRTCFISVSITLSINGTILSQVWHFLSFYPWQQISRQTIPCVFDGNIACGSVQYRLLSQQVLDTALYWPLVNNARYPRVYTACQVSTSLSLLRGQFFGHVTQSFIPKVRKTLRDKPEGLKGGEGRFGRIIVPCWGNYYLLSQISNSDVTVNLITTLLQMNSHLNRFGLKSDQHLNSSCCLSHSCYYLPWENLFRVIFCSLR